MEVVEIYSVVGEESGANSSVISKPSISDSTNYTITIGVGNSNMSNGSNSSAFGSTAIGGRGVSDGGVQHLKLLKVAIYNGW